MAMLNINGTYPFDGGRWRRVKSLSPQEAFELLSVPEEIKKLWPRQYPFINKGYVILGGNLPSVSSTQAAFLELGFGALNLKGLPSGVQAVYLHDGDFMLIESVAKESE